MTHTITTLHTHDYQASCTCGWLGPAQPHKQIALNDGYLHLAERGLPLTTTTKRKAKAQR